MSTPIDYISKLLSSPWGLDKIRGRTILSGIIHPLLQSTRPASARPKEDIFGDPLPAMQVLGTVAKIPLTGVISLDVPDWIKSYGINLTDANDIEEELEEALADANVEIIVFDVDSPGGLSIAGDKLFEVVEAANRRKPVFAYCADGRQMCSAAYNAICPSRAILCGRFAADIGCIGSYLAYLDDTEFWTQMGLKWEVFRGHEESIKGIGESVPLTDAQREFLQSRVDYYDAQIKKNVRKYRTSIAEEDLRGQFYNGIVAAQRGFVGGHAPDLQSAIAKFQRMLRAAA